MLETGSSCSSDFRENRVKFCQNPSPPSGSQTLRMKRIQGNKYLWLMHATRMTVVSIYNTPACRRNNVFFSFFDFFLSFFMYVCTYRIIKPHHCTVLEPSVKVTVFRTPADTFLHRPQVEFANAVRLHYI